MQKIKEKYDVVIIGSGPSGCACAIRCAQLGLKTLCVDNLQHKRSRKLLPGLFTNAVSLETIALLESAKLYDAILNKINAHGIYAEEVTLNLSQMIARKDNILAQVNQNLNKQFAAHRIDFIHGKAKLLDPKTVEVSSILQPEDNKINAEQIILATESSPISVPCATIDNEYILDSSAALSLKELPKRLAILGAGVIGLELGGIWNRLGAETILLDAQETFLGLADHQISREAYKIFSAQGLELRPGTRVISTKVTGKKVHVEYQDAEGTHAIRVDKLIVASGRKPNTENLAEASANLLLDENGYVHVNENFRTNLPGVYAIGDLTMLGPMLTHNGMAEGVFVAEQIAGIQSSPIDYNTTPNVIYTDPEIAWVGQTEQALKAMGVAIKIGTFPLILNPKAISEDASDGMVKIIVCAKTELLLGVHIISRNASELIAEAVLALEFSANSEDIKRTMHPYPALVESIREATLAIKKRGE